jgi:hypothetical protein
MITNEFKKSFVATRLRPVASNLGRALPHPLPKRKQPVRFGHIEQISTDDATRQ